MLRRWTLAVLEKNVLFTNVIKRHKLKPRMFGTQKITEPVNQLKVQDNQENISKLGKVPVGEVIESNDLSTKGLEEDDVEKVFEEIAQGDAQIKQQLQLMLYEIMIHKEEGGKVPNNLTKKHWEELLTLSNGIRRIKYLKFLFKKEHLKKSKKAKEHLKKDSMDSILELKQRVPHIYYGLGGDSLFLRIYPEKLFVTQDVRALTNKLFAPPIIFDCSYQQYMSRVSTKYCARQIVDSFSINRQHPHPCSIQLLNVKEDDLLMEYLKLLNNKMGEQNTVFEVSEKSYLDLYPKEKLVYLTPHCQHELIDFRPDDIYIIGAFVDKGIGVQASYGKAKEEGLRMAKLPLDRYLLWRKGTKSLTLNNVINILLDLRYYRNWKNALKTIPRRHLT